MNRTWPIRSILLLCLLSACNARPLPDPGWWGSDDVWAGFGNDIAEDNKAIPDSLLRVEQYSESVLFNVVEYDRQHRLLFRYHKQDWGDTTPGRYATMLAAYVYNDDRLIKSYLLHSNVGLTVNYYVYDLLGMRVKCYTRVNSYDPRYTQANTNPFRYLEKVTSYQALLNHPEVLELERREKSQLASEAIYGLPSQLQEELYYDGKGRIDSRYTYFYNSQGLLSRTQHIQRSPAPTFKYMREYNAQKLLAKEYTVGSGPDTSEVKQYWYDKKGRLATAMRLEERVEKSDLYPNSYTVFDKIILRYDAHDAVRQAAEYRVTRGSWCGSECEEELRRLTTFHRNKEGFIVESREDDCVDDTVKISRYNYVYRGHQTQ